MADQIVSELAALTGATLATGDKFYVVDVSAGTSGGKSITAAEMLTGLGLVGALVVQGSSSAIKTTIQTVESGIRKGGQIVWTGKAADMTAQLGQYDYGWEFLFTPGSASVGVSSIVEFGVPLVFSIRSTLTGAGPYFCVRDNFDAMDLTLRMNRTTKYGEIYVGNFEGSDAVVSGFASLGLKFGVSVDGGGGTYVTTFPFVMPGDGTPSYFQQTGISLRLKTPSTASNPGLAFNNGLGDLLVVSSVGNSGVSWLNSYAGIVFGTGDSTPLTNGRVWIVDSGMGVGATPDASAQLDVTSTTRGFLPPRMTTTQRNAIASPPSGLVVYNTTTGKLNVRGASAWEAVTSA